MGSPSPQLSRSVHGFVLMVCAQFMFTIYLAWAYAPSSMWHGLGITYLPDKYWAIALPSWFIVTILTFACCIYPGYILSCSPRTPNLVDDSFTNYDVAEPLAGVDIAPLRDIPIAEMNKILYRKRK